MCTESNLIVKDLIAPLLGFFGTLFIAGMAYNGILVKLQKDTQIKWIDEFRNEIATLITYCREINDLIKSNRFSADKRDKLLHDLTFSVTIIQLYLDMEKNSHSLMTEKLKELVFSTSKKSNNSELNETIDYLGTLAKKIIEEERVEINKVKFPILNQS